VNVLKVVIQRCTDDRITLPHLTIQSKHKLSNVEKRVKRGKNMLEPLPEILSTVDWSIIHRRCSSMSLKVIFRRSGKKGNKDACKIRGF